MKYKVIKSCYKLSNKTVYPIGSEIELEIDQAVELIKEGYLEIIDTVETPKPKKSK